MQDLWGPVAPAREGWPAKQHARACRGEQTAKVSRREHGLPCVGSLRALEATRELQIARAFGWGRREQLPTRETAPSHPKPPQAGHDPAAACCQPTHKQPALALPQLGGGSGTLPPLDPGPTPQEMRYNPGYISFPGGSARGQGAGGSPNHPQAAVVLAQVACGSAGNTRRRGRAQPAGVWGGTGPSRESEAAPSAPSQTRALFAARGWLLRLSTTQHKASHAPFCSLLPFARPYMPARVASRANLLARGPQGPKDPALIDTMFLVIFV